jgi:hypothetical protein
MPVLVNFVSIPRKYLDTTCQLHAAMPVCIGFLTAVLSAPSLSLSSRLLITGRASFLFFELTFVPLQLWSLAPPRHLFGFYSLEVSRKRSRLPFYVINDLRHILNERTGLYRKGKCINTSRISCGIPSDVVNTCRVIDSSQYEINR